MCGRPSFHLEEDGMYERTIGFLVAAELSAMFWAALFLVLGSI
ncbi:hypothetical protein GGD56_000171 [Rhizobium mongolense]|jgi:hypothetical protein|uniref:Uncharacterized protein n=2 Tax=Rhizobium mongolense TaxID=57676 RepID=A0ABR6IEQ9_9HYPH|nr:hypothetical protein [Rhizobium mongolense]TVZ73630.1 hypothetical protein BCL32_1878 [Rhizobium mongolense USDA 1844]